MDQALIESIKKNTIRSYSTIALVNKLTRNPHDLIIIDELKRRANHKPKCYKLAMIRLEKEKFKTKVGLGYKNEAYFSEEEMLNGFTCTFEDLSQSEKAIYNNAVKFCRI
jgi:hypothetical protein